MKKSWKPQHRTLWYANPLLYIVLIIISIVVCLILTSIFKSILCLAPIALFAGMWYWCVMQLNVYKDYGYSKLTIDTDRRMIIFDDNCVIPFNSIVDVKFKIEEVRDVFSYEHVNEADYESRSFGRNADSTLFRFCSSMNITTHDGRNIKFYIDFPNAAKDILNSVRACGVKVTASDDFDANASGLVAVVFLVVPVIIWALIQFLIR